MKARTVAKVARLKKLPNKGRYGMSRHRESFVSTLGDSDWTEPVGDTRSTRQLIVVVAFTLPLVLFILGLLAEIFGGE